MTKTELSLIQPGDIVLHRFLGATYYVERVTPEKAECRQQLVNGMAGNTVMILRQDLVVLSILNPEPE